MCFPFGWLTYSASALSGVSSVLPFKEYAVSLKKLTGLTPYQLWTRKYWIDDLISRAVLKFASDNYALCMCAGGTIEVLTFQKRLFSVVRLTLSSSRTRSANGHPRLGTIRRSREEMSHALGLCLFRNYQFWSQTQGISTTTRGSPIWAISTWSVL